MKNAILASVMFLASLSANAASLENVDAPATLFKCSQGPVGEYKYNFSIEITEAQVGVYQSSMIARYAAIELPILEAEIGSELPTDEAKFSCVYESGESNQYRAEIKVYEDSVIVYQSSMNGRYAPLKFDILSAE